MKLLYPRKVILPEHLRIIRAEGVNLYWISILRAVKYTGKVTTTYTETTVPYDREHYYIKGVPVYKDGTPKNMFKKK